MQERQINFLKFKNKTNSIFVNLQRNLNNLSFQGRPETIAPYLV